MPGVSQRAFFSYARSDSNFVLKIAHALRNEGRAIWVDQLDIPKGARWDMEVEKALKASHCLLVALSPATAESQNVLDEVSYALDEKKTVLPILLQSCSIPFRLKRLQYIDFTADFDGAYLQLRAALDALSPSAAELQTDPSPPAVMAVLSADQPAIHAASRPSVSTANPLGSDPVADKAVGKPGGIPMSVVYAGLAAGALVIGLSMRGSPKEPPAESDPAASVPAPHANTPVATPSPATTPAAVTPTLASAEKSPVPHQISDRQVQDFVKSYVAAQNGGNPDELLRFYAEKVDYYDEKAATRKFILQDKQIYYRRWPEVENRLASPVEMEQAGDGTVHVAYTIKYRVANATRGDSKTGTTREELQLRSAEGVLAIVMQRQKVFSAGN